jgi:hypothetical protein
LRIAYTQSFCDGVGVTSASSKHLEIFALFPVRHFGLEALDLDVLLHLRPEMRYPQTMTKLLDQALEVARGLSSDAQDEIARIVLQLAGNDEAAPLALSADERAAVALSKAAAERGEFATDEQVRATWAKHGL